MSRARYDVVIVGGGPAGLTAALYLARSRRRTLVLDGGRPRNRQAAHAHGVFTRDGAPPLDLLAEARTQLAHYADADFRAVEAVSVEGHKGRFVVRLVDGDKVEARRVVLACGVRDEFPPIPGIGEIWGRRVHACSYCHGYEERDRPLATLAEGEAALAAVASLIAISRDIVLCTHGSSLTTRNRARIEAHGVAIIDAPLVRIDDTGDAVALSFADGRVIKRGALFMKSNLRLASDLPARLGCRLNGLARIVVNESWETSVAGVYAAGDIAADKKFVAVAAASGAEAAIAIDGVLAQEDFGGEWSAPLCGNASALVSPPVLEEAIS
jgi:thioredoxin reductase